jgi:hypothetical protein
VDRNKKSEEKKICIDLEELVILHRTHLINILNKIKNNDGISKRELLIELPKQVYHDFTGLKWLEKNEWIYIQVTKSYKRGRSKHKLYLTEKGRERLEYLNKLCESIKNYYT